MSVSCRICLGEVAADDAYHSRCLRGLFGVPRAPRFDVALGKLHTAALAMVGRTSLSGIQRKISVSLSTDRQTLQVAEGGGRFILKPQTELYPRLPEIEHLTTRLAQLVEIEVPAFGLVSLQDGSLAYISRRFDRRGDGTKVRQEDFCQLAERSPKDKYDGSAELCVRLLRTFASESVIEILKFYRQLVFHWWSGNGDMHLKNFSLLIDDEGRCRLTPAYDLVCTRLVIPEDPLALSILGKKDNLNRDLWLRFADYCELPERTATQVLARQAGAEEPGAALIEASYLDPEMKRRYVDLIRARSAILTANGR